MERLLVAQSGHSPKLSCQLSADIVAKVENRATRKISRKLIFGLLRRRVAFQRHCHYGGPWSILDETIWSLTSPLVKRISGSEKFRSSPQKDFCNNICQEETRALQQTASLFDHVGAAEQRQRQARQVHRSLAIMPRAAMEPARRSHG